MLLNPGPIDHIASQIAEARDRCKYRGLEPTIYAADDRDRPCHIRAKRVGHAVNRAVGRDDVNRIATLRPEQSRRVANHRRTGCPKGQFVYGACDEAVARVEIRQTAIAAQVIAILHDNALCAE